MTPNIRPSGQEAFAQAAAFFGNTEIPRSERVSNLLALLQSSLAPQLRQQLGDPILELLCAEQIVPEAYRQWRPLVQDALRYVLSHISEARLAPKLIEQFELPTDTPAETRLLRFVGRMPGFQKLGQVLARNRNLSPSLRAALTELENSIRDCSAAEIRAVIDEQLASRLRSYEVEIEADMLSEATVSAVVRFRWRNPQSGRTERGVFKVLKPYVLSCFAEDMELLQEVAEYLESRHDQYGIARNVLLDTFSDVRRLLEHEIDFEREQATLLKAAELYGSLPRVRTPRLIPDLCACLVTAMSEERGTKITDAVPALSPWQRQQLAAQIVDCLIATPLFSPAAGEAAQPTMFHADPHAGNLLYDASSGTIVVLDWALTEQLSNAQRRQVALLLIMFALRDPVGMYTALLELSPTANSEQQRLMRDCIDESLARMALPGMMDLTRLLDRLALEGVPFPASLLMFRKVLFTLDGVLHNIAGPRFSIDIALAGYLVRRSIFAGPAAGLPLIANDWVAVHWSALSYGSRLWSLPLSCWPKPRERSSTKQHCT